MKPNVNAEFMSFSKTKLDATKVDFWGLGKADQMGSERCIQSG
jgi:hypothetical protein